MCYSENFSEELLRKTLNLNFIKFRTMCIIYYLFFIEILLFIPNIFNLTSYIIILKKNIFLIIFVNQPSIIRHETESNSVRPSHIVEKTLTNHLN